MTLKNAKTILFASLIAAMILPLSGMNYAQAEETEKLTDEEIEILLEKATGQYLIIERIKEKLEEQGKDTNKRLEKLEKKYDKNVSILNEYGYITTEQLDEDPAKYDKTLGNLEESPNAEQGASLQNCCEQQIFYFEAGHFYPTWWGLWWSYEGSDAGQAETLHFSGDSDTSESTLEDDYNKLRPVMQVQLQKAGSATFSYVYTFVGDSVGATESGSAATTSYNNVEVIPFDQINQSVEAGDRVDVDVTLTSLS